MCGPMRFEHSLRVRILIAIVPCSFFARGVDGPGHTTVKGAWVKGAVAQFLVKMSCFCIGEISSLGSG